MEHIDLEFQIFQSTIFYNNYFLNIVPFRGVGGENQGNDFYKQIMLLF